MRYFRSRQVNASHVSLQNAPCLAKCFDMEKKVRQSRMLAVSVLLASAMPIQAAPITLYNTGVDDFGAARINGQNETHYDLISAPLPLPGDPNVIAGAGFPIPPWLPDSPSTGSPCDNSVSRWIAPTAINIGTQHPTTGSYIYRQAFDLTGFNLSTVSISGCWAADNNGTGIFINGVQISPAFPQAGFSDWTAFTITSGFYNQNANNLDFRVDNLSGPTGLRVVYLTRGADLTVPEPTSIGMVSLALLVLGLLRHRKI